MMDLIEERFEKASIIICSQMSVKAWYEIIGESTIADAILDRIINSSHRIELREYLYVKKLTWIKILIQINHYIHLLECGTRNFVRFNYLTLGIVSPN